MSQKQERNAQGSSKQPSAPSDAQIRAALQERIARAGDLPSGLINVQVQDGIATLQGQVNLGGERERASEIAEDTTGVRAVVNRLSIKASDRADQALGQAVQQALESDPAQAFSNVSVSADAHRVVLAGSVDRSASKEAAEKLAWYVPGVATVENQIRVVPGYTRADDEIRAEVLRNLRADAYVANDQLDVSVENGTVRLSGAVASAFEKHRARMRAEVAGVVDVEDAQVDVRPQLRQVQRYAPVTPTDAETRAAIGDAFAADPRISKATVDFKVKYGVVTLNGVVGSIAEKLAAGEDARRAIGVSAVVNQLQVRSWADSGAGSLENHVLTRLQQHPYIDARRLRVRANGTAISLDGSVSSQFERARAERVVGTIPGVTQVSNNLTVTAANVNERSDEDIAAEVKRALYWDRRVAQADVSVSVYAGEVTIRGQVQNAEVYDAVLEDVFALYPRAVVNELTLPKRQRE